MYDAMINPLIDAEVLVALATYIPTIKPLNRLSQWGNDALREINNSMGALDMLVFMYTRQDREQDLPYSVLAASSLTGWVCDVLQGRRQGTAGGAAAQPGGEACIASTCQRLHLPSVWQSSTDMVRC